MVELAQALRQKICRATVRASSAAKRQASLVLRLLLLAAFAVVPAGVALPASSTTKYIKAKIVTEVVGSFGKSDLSSTPLAPSPLVWCFKDKPGFVFTDGQKVMRATFGEPVQEVLTADWYFDPNSLVCSDDGSALVVMSNDGSDLLIMSGTRIGIYKTGLPPASARDLQLGQMLSPTGTAIAAPFHLAFSSGDDVLRELKMVYIDGGKSFSWRDNEVLYFHPATKSVLSYDISTARTAVLKDLGSRIGNPSDQWANIATCDKDTYIAANWHHSDGSGGHVLVSQSGDLALKPDAGKYSADVKGADSSISVKGHRNSLCMILSEFSTMESEFTMLKLMFEDGLVNYVLPRDTTLVYLPTVAPHGCLVLGQTSPHGKDGQLIAEQQRIVALRITRSGRCKS